MTQPKNSFWISLKAAALLAAIFTLVIILPAVVLTGCDSPREGAVSFRHEPCPAGFTCQCVADPVGGSSSSDGGSSSSSSSSDGSSSSGGPNPLALLSDDFSGDLSEWVTFRPWDNSRIEIVGGVLEIEPADETAWYNERTSSQTGKAVGPGDFMVTTHITVASADGSPLYPGWDWRLAGINVRDPGGSSDAVHIALGQTNATGLQWESKTTDGNVSVWADEPWAQDNADLRICRVGDTLQVLISDGTGFVPVLTVDRPDLAGDVMVGPVTYAATTPANVLAQYDYVDFASIGSLVECAGG